MADSPKRMICRGISLLLRPIPVIKAIHETRNTHTPVKISTWFMQKVIGFNRNAYWPVHFTSTVSHPENIVIGVETSPGYMPGCYLQGMGSIHIGDYTFIAANVGIISANHDVYDKRKHSFKRGVKIGRYCWIGMNAVILPGVELGDFTVVGAGSVVTKSFPDGYCVIAGNPAIVQRKLEREKCVRYESEVRYHGYIPKESFETYRRKHLRA